MPSNNDIGVADPLFAHYDAASEAPAALRFDRHPGRPAATSPRDGRELDAAGDLPPALAKR